MESEEAEGQKKGKVSWGRNNDPIKLEVSAGSRKDVCAGAVCWWV